MKLERKIAGKTPSDRMSNALTMVLSVLKSELLTKESSIKNANREKRIAPKKPTP